MPTAGASLLVGTNNLYDFGTSVARWRKLWAVNGDFSGSLQVGSNLVAVSPDAGNALSWRANGFYATSSGGGGDLFDPIVRDEILFAPSPSGAVDTPLTRVGAGVLRLQRPGAAGGAADGVELSLSSRSGPGGTTGAASLDWQVDGNIRWLLQATPNNGPLILYDYGSDGLSFQERLRFDHLSLTTLWGTTGMPPWLQIKIPASTSSGFIGQAVASVATSGSIRLDITANAFYNGSAWVIQDTTLPGAVMTFMGSTSDTSTLMGIWDLSPGTGAFNGRYNFLRNGTLQITPSGTNVGIDSYNPIRVRPGPSNLAGVWYMSPDNTDRVFAGLESASTNLWRIWGTALGRNIVGINLDNGAVSFSNDIYVNAYVYCNTNNLFLYSNNNNIQMHAGGTYIHPSGDNTINMGHPGLRWSNVYGVNAQFSEGIFSNNVTASGGILQAGSSGSWYTRYYYHQLYAYYGARYGIINSANAGFSFQPSPGAELFVIENSSQGVYCNTATLVVDFGRSDRRWVTMYCQSVNQSCSAAVKEEITDVDIHSVLDDLLHTPVVDFKYKEPEVDKLPEHFELSSTPKPHQLGIIAERTPKRLLLDDESGSPMALAAAAIAGVQAVHDKLEAALARIAELEGKLI